MNVIWWVVCALILIRNDQTHSAQILAMLPIAAKSHWNVLDAVLQTLVAGGHNVTAVTPFLKNKPITNYTEVDMSRLVPSGFEMSWEKVMGEKSVANNLPFLSSNHRHMCKTVFENENFWRVIESHKQESIFLIT